MTLLLLLLFSNPASQDLHVRQIDGAFQLTWGQHLLARATTDLDNLRTFQSGDLAVATWSQVDGAVAVEKYAILKDGALKSSGILDPRLHLRSVVFDPLLGESGLVDLRSSSPEENVQIVQFRTPVLAHYRQTLNDMGAVVLDYLPANALIVRYPKGQLQQLEELSWVRWVGPYQPAFRLDPFYVQHVGTAESDYSTGLYNIKLFDYAMEIKEDTALRLQSLGAQVKYVNGGRFIVTAELSHHQLFEVINWDLVAFVDAWSDYEKDMDVVRDLSGANYIETMAGYDGTGVRGEVFDSGFNLTHVDFQNTPLILHTPNTPDSHGASTSGIVFGDGTGNPAARGLLPAGQGIVADYDAVPITGMARYDNTGELLQAPYFAVFQTSSVGTTRTTDYTTFSQDSDTMLFDFDLLHCQSQSNALSRDSRPQSWAKNMVSVGGFFHFNTLDTSDDCWGCGSGGGSIGPAPDGRIKPDLSHFYDSTLTTTTGSTTAYTQFGGTSGATPITCGHHGLFFQMWSDGIFGNATPGATVFDNRPHLTMTKSMMINTANQYPFDGAADDMSRYHQGWGRVDMQRLYDNRDDFFLIDESVVLSNLEKSVFTLSVAPGQSELRITMAYLEPPGNPAATIHTINDLNLRVTSPDGEIYWGNFGLVDGNFSVPGGLPTPLDTVENVWVENPAAGIWTVEVIAASIVQDAHVETEGGVDADFSIAAHPVSASSEAFLMTPVEGFPLRIEPGVTTPINLHVLEGTGTISTTPTLHYRTLGGAFTPLAMTAAGPDQYSATLPAFAIGSDPEFYFELQGSTYPMNAPGSLFQITVDADDVLFEDDMETDMGWTVGAIDDTATTGIWERVDPVSTVSQTELDHTPGAASMAYVTGQSNDPASNGENDVDGGKTTLFTPVFDLSAEPEADIEYWRWYANNFGTANDDVFTIDVSNDGTNWVNVETLGPTGPGTRGSWILHRFRVADFVTPTATVQVRFVADDSGTGSIVEAGVDDLRVLVEQTASCPPLSAQLPLWPDPVSILDMIMCL